MEGGAATAGRIAIETSTATLRCPGEKKALSSWSSEAPGAVHADGFFHRAAHWPGKLSQKHLSLVEDYKRKRVNHWRQPSGPCSKKSERTSHPTGGGGLHCGAGRRQAA